MLKFKEVSIIGYKSIMEELQYNFCNNGLHLIVGENGTGKSNFLESIVWCLHGKTIKNIRVDQVVNWDSETGTKVELVLEKDDKEYRIIRCRNFSGFSNKPVIYVNDKEIQTTNSQEIIDSIIQLSWDELLTSVYYSAENFRSFLEMRTDDRKRFMENIFGVSLFDNAYNNAVIERKAIKNKIKLFNEREGMFLVSLKDLETNISLLEQKILEWDKSIGNEEKQITLELSNIENSVQNIDKLTELLGNIENSLISLYEKDKIYSRDFVLYKKSKKLYDNITAKFSKCKMEISSLTDKIDNYQMALTMLKKNLSNLKNSIKDKKRNIVIMENSGAICDVCNSIITDKTKFNEVLQSKRIELECEILELKKVASDISNLSEKRNYLIGTREIVGMEHDDYKHYLERLDSQNLQYNSEMHDDILTNIDKMESAKKSIKAKINQTSNEKESKKETLHKRLKILKETINPHSEIYDNIVSQRQSAQKEIELINKERGDSLYLLDHIEFLENAFKRDIKSVVLARVIPTFNTLLNDYLSKLFDNCYLNFDNSLDYSLVYNGSNIENVNQFSTGQRARLNFAICLAVYSVLKTYREAINIMFFDELLDFGLDEAGQHIAFEILSEFDPAVYIVSHRAPQIDFDSIIRFTNNNGTKLGE